MILFSYSIPTGELPPPRPRACFGRDKLIQEVVGLAENLTPIALIGPGGIGKTSIALAVLHHDRIKKRFGDNRRFIPCDQFPASGPHFLSRLSKVVGAGVENPEDLTPLRPFLSSMETIIFLDNAESILDPRGPNGREIYVMVEELSEFDNICLCLTSRISTIPPACETLDVPTLSTEAARDTFYRIYKNGEQSGPVNSILEQLDFHPLSITLLATVAQHNRWDTDRLANEWEKQRTDMLHTEHDRSLATAIELSLASPMFQELGPDARELLGVIAFLPQGVNEKNLDRLFPTLSRGTNTLDKLCILSLTYRNNGFVTMLAPLRDYLCPKDPTSSSLLRTTKERYFSWLSIDINPDRPGFEEAQWIRSEDVNVEHLLDAFTSVDINSVDTWTACARFMRHLYWHKKRLVALGPKIKGLPDNHHSKPQCLLELSRLFDSVGNYVEYKQLLVYALRLWRERGEDIEVAETLRFVSKANQLLGLHKEGIKQVEEASGIYKRLGRLQGQIYCWQRLSRLLYGDGQPDAAKEAASRVINLPLNNAGQFPVCECYHVLGLICLSKGQTKDAINHFETALGIASPLGWHDQLFSNHYSLAELFFSENRLADAHTHIEHAKSHAIDGTYHLGRAMRLQARFWYKECKFEEAKSEASRAADVYERLGATKDLEDCKAILRDIEEAAKEPAGSRKPDLDGELPKTTLFPTPANSSFSARGAG